MNKGAITISRPSYGDGREQIEITIKDKDAVVSFVKLQISLPEFVKALTGLGNAECEIETRYLEVVGKKRETKQIEFKISDKWTSGDSKKIAKVRAKKHTPEGWIADEYYGSQGSFFTNKDDEYWARTTITRWVDKK